MTPFRQEPDDLRGPVLVWVGVITLVIFTCASIWAGMIWKSRSRDLEPNGPAPARELGKREIGMVKQVPFEQRSEAPALRAAKLERLRSYGWVDRKAGIIHVPVERAYELAIAEQKGRAP